MATSKQMQERAKARKAAAKEALIPVPVTQEILEVVKVTKEKWESIGKPLGHCVAFALFAQRELKARGIEAELVMGYAGYQSDASFKSMLVWHPNYKKELLNKGVELHAWLELPGEIYLDVSMMSFDKLLLIYEEQDGIKCAPWNQDFNLVYKRDAKKAYQKLLANNGILTTRGFFLHDTGHYFTADAHKNSAILSQWDLM